MPGMERTLCARSRPDILHTGVDASERHQDGKLARRQLLAKQSIFQVVLSGSSFV
jgi:hypothetical protein